MRASKGVRRLAILLGSIGSTVWLIFVALVTELFTKIEAPWVWVLLVVIAGICFLIPFLLVHGAAWVIRGFREDNGNRPNGQVGMRTDLGGEALRSPVLTEKETEERESKLSKESYGYNELEIMKQQFVGLLRGAPLRYLIVCGILAILILLEFLLSGCTTIQKTLS
jgi:hypothetical protein